MSELRLALAGDTMLGRKVADAIRRREAEPLVDAGVVQSVREADLFVLNLECCIAEQGERWPDPAKPFLWLRRCRPRVRLSSPVTLRMCSTVSASASSTTSATSSTTTRLIRACAT